MIEQAATVIAQDNIELASAFIQKTAVERAIPEIDKRLASVSNSSIASRCSGVVEKVDVSQFKSSLALVSLARKKVNTNIHCYKSTYTHF